MGLANLSNQAAFDALAGRELPTLGGCWLRLVDCMGADESIVQAARVSYGAGTRTRSEDRDLIRYMLSGGYEGRCPHSSPFEQCEVKLHLRIPMDAWRQMVRHRTASINEYSTRYSEAIDETLVTAPGQWRLQSTANRQGSEGFVTEWPGGAIPAGLSGLQDFESPGHYLSAMESGLHRRARAVYEERLRFGVAREQARKDLPLATMTEAYWKCDLHNIFHFLKLRMDGHAQLELRTFANVLGRDIVAPLFPLAWEAFEDYVLGSVVLSRLEVEAAREILGRRGRSADGALSARFENRRERAAARAKLVRLGIIGES